MKFIIKLFPEITIKSTPVRKRFIKMLRKNIRTILKRVDENIDVCGVWDHIEVTTSSNDQILVAEVGDLLSHIPGIAYWLQVAEHKLVSLDDVLEKAVEAHSETLAGKTFCVRCNRTGKHDFQSIEVERFVGGGLIQQTEAKRVSLKNPEITVRIDIKNDRYFMTQKRGAGLGGYPLGSQEPVLSLISGGFDSTVSSFLTMKRGIRTHFCFFNLGGHAHELAVKEVAFYLWNRFGSSRQVKFVTVPFEGVVEEILTKVDNAQMGVILKRMMLRAATKVAKEMEMAALVTGEAIGQVSSQTLPNLAVIDSVTDALVLRPLITMDKQAIIDISIQIGTEEFVRNIPEYCAVISKNPTTRARVERIVAEEERFNFDVLEDAIQSRRTVSIHDIIADDLTREEVEVVSEVHQGEVIIDIRHPTEEEIKPFTMPGREVVIIPFYQLRTRFPELDNNRHYLLYCERGVMSQLHAMHLREEGHENVGIFNPKP
ncbi:tRNA uracil 4-sulfurtransferase ThiI [Endozoicomonas sp. GU-1]|uniref:tRNA uracil 4-sulfurtransferase ThiI n=1 Tax=Endozoicomonas sp. GU-1 TaxID=3009078 RepID=UPI0022B3944E|nr:tRNA uracil 4-sulfurtransferase ThiI [Endozoicomonas sp. GU-1]WBA82454.1 tRNA 4-thiouridine(8) synthase ThiI [Endozoicomonas sp. GU-1]WBA85387.1 tRNA 4-thiouridine(8) synthase ThiI [Endozoicomonas sp. GU-1]